MQTHYDDDARLERQRSLLESLGKKADKMTAAGESEITAGKPDEEALAEWRHGDMTVRHMPDDEHGVLRISTGGGSSKCHGLKLNYLVFRGNLGECEQLLRKALSAITKYR